MNVYRQGGGKQQREFGRHVVKRDGHLLGSCRFDPATGDRGSFLETKCRLGFCKLSGGPLLDREAVQLCATALDQDSAIDEIDDDVGLRSSGQLDFLLEEPDRLL